jgi:hypothetical protein
MDGGMWKRKRRVNWGRSDGQSGIALNDKDFPYKSGGRNREESIRLADEAVLAMMEVDNITPPSEGPLEAGATRVGTMCLSVTMVAGR